MNNRNENNLKDKYIIIKHEYCSLADILCRTARCETIAIEKNTGYFIEKGKGHTSAEALIDLEAKLKRWHQY